MKNKYSVEQLTPIVAESTNYSDVCRRLLLRPNGGHHRSLKNRIILFGIDTSHFTKKRPGGNLSGKKHFSELLIKRNDGLRTHGPRLRKALIESGVEDKCKECGQEPFWNGKVLVLQIDHIDGDSTNNVKENLRIICPNCHTQTDNFCYKNRKL